MENTFIGPKIILPNDIEKQEIELEKTSVVNNISYTPSGGYFIAKFDDDNRMEEFILCDDTVSNNKKQSLLADGWIEIQEIDWKYYIGDIDKGENGTGYILGTSGKPVSAPPLTKKDKMKLIKEAYEMQIKEIKDALFAAILTDNEEFISELKQEYAFVMNSYQNALLEVE